ncbi:MAG TPA: hypothetical protein VF866_04760 [Xanthobacteraceae bacterium]
MDKRLLAYHEAGHAVVARLLGVGVAVVIMFPTADQKAGVKTKSAEWETGDDPEAVAHACELDAKVVMAGSIAEQIHRPIKTRTKLERRRKHGWASDTENASSFVGKAVLIRSGVPPAVFHFEGNKDYDYDVTPEQIATANALLRRLHGETHKLLKDNWPAVERVAAAFMEQPLVSEEEIDALIARARTLRRKGRATSN